MSSEEVPEWQVMFGARVKTPVDMPDDILKDTISISIQELNQCDNLEKNGQEYIRRIKEHMDEVWEPNWHIIVGRNFGSKVTHETKRFVYFYLPEKSWYLMVYKA